MKIGRPLRIIEVVPLEEPVIEPAVPSEPAEPAEPVTVPEEEPEPVPV